MSVAEQLGGWRPIETAPKDGTPILVWVPQSDPDYNAVHVVRWYKHASLGAYSHRWMQMTYQVWGNHVSGRPTHWMPRPEGPVRG